MKYLVVILLFVGCSTERKAQKKVAWLLAHDKLDDACARVYPNRDSVIVKDSVRFDTLYVDGEPVIIRDTSFSRGDTVVKVIEKKCPPVQTITKTLRRDSIIYRTNTAEVERLKGELLAKEAQIKSKDDIIIKQQVKIDKNDWWKVACLITWFVVLLGFVFRFFIIKKPI